MERKLRQWRLMCRGIYFPSKKGSISIVVFIFSDALFLFRLGNRTAKLLFQTFMILVCLSKDTQNENKA